MLILNILLKITGFTQEQLANYVGISRASINSWLNDDSSMSDLSKHKIANKFNFPVIYFKYDLNQNIEIYKIIYSTIYNNWNNNKQLDTHNKMQDILSKIEVDYIPELKNSNNRIIEALIDGNNPFTGEKIKDSILCDKRVKEAIISIYNKNIQKFGVSNITKNDLNREERSLFEKLRKWRKNKYIEEGYFNAFIVFSDKELINIIKADINDKTDLLKIKGIGNIKYEKYADEIFSIINAYRKEAF